MRGKYAVIFASTKFNANSEYQAFDSELMSLAQEQPGFLGYESVVNENKSIFISYWDSKEAIESWRVHAKHLSAKHRVEEWYERYLSQICLIESSHEWRKSIE
jgi:heme-degrading monooxygenase HmoA